MATRKSIKTRRTATMITLKREVTSKYLITLFTLIILLICSSKSSYGYLIGQDLHSVEDNLLTYDSETGLQWLDLTNTINMSVNNVLNATSPGKSLSDFRYASLDEVITLAEHAGMSVYPFIGGGGVIGPTTVENVVPARFLVSLVGYTNPGNNIYDDNTFGYTGTSAGSGEFIIAQISIGSNNSWANFRKQLNGDTTFSSPYFGHWLVKKTLPIANAGPDQTVPEGTAVALDGTGSTGQNLAYSWVQLAGPTVQLSGASTAAPTFNAPMLPDGFGSQTLTFQLTVTNASGSSTATVSITETNVNHAPIAIAGGNQVAQEGSSVTLLGTNSYDPDGDALTYIWVQTSGPSVQLAGDNTATAMFTAPLVAGGVGSGETLGFTLTVSDGALTSTDKVVVTVEQVDHPPVANAGLPQTVNNGTLVTLNGSASSDPDGDPLMFQWTQTDGPSVMLLNATTANPSFTAPVVSVPTDLTFQLTVSDGAMVSAPASVAVKVIRPDDPPLCSQAQATPSQLWPPNHGMSSVRITGVSDPDNDSIAISITHVAQDEPVNGLGDGDTSPDAVIQGSIVLLRAERAGKGNGRVYKVFFTADDGRGGVCAGSVKVVVPQSMKPGLPVIDDGQLYDSTKP